MRKLSNSCLPLILAACSGAVLSQSAGAPPAGVHDVQWSADGTARLQTQVAAGKFVEWCAPLRKQEKVEWRFDAASPLEMNVHFHVGKKVEFPVKKDAVAVAHGTLIVVADQDYCWMWTNRSSQSIRLDAALQKPK